MMRQKIRLGKLMKSRSSLKYLKRDLNAQLLNAQPFRKTVQIMANFSN